MTHLLLQPLLLLLNLLLQDLTELLHLLVMLSHTPAGDSTARGVVRPRCSGCRSLGPHIAHGTCRLQLAQPGGVHPARTCPAV